MAHKNKPIQKVRNGRIIRRNNLVQDDTFVRDRRPDEQREVRSVQPKQEELTNEKGRTLKVMGLHPDCTNEDLYVYVQQYRNYSQPKEHSKSA